MYIRISCWTPEFHWLYRMPSKTAIFLRLLFEISISAAILIIGIQIIAKRYNINDDHQTNVGLLGFIACLFYFGRPCSGLYTIIIRWRCENEPLTDAYGNNVCPKTLMIKCPICVFGEKYLFDIGPFAFHCVMLLLSLAELALWGNKFREVVIQGYVWYRLVSLPFAMALVAWGMYRVDSSKQMVDEPSAKV